MKTVPIKSARSAIIVEREESRLLETISTSFVIRDKISPVWLRSKYFSGKRLIFSEIWPRSCCANLFVTSVIVNDSISVSNELIIYSTASRITKWFMRSRFIFGSTIERIDSGSSSNFFSIALASFLSSASIDFTSSPNFCWSSSVIVVPR